MYLRDQSYTQTKIFTGGSSHYKVSLRPHTIEIFGLPNKRLNKSLFWRGSFLICEVTVKYCSIISSKSANQCTLI